MSENQFIASSVLLSQSRLLYITVTISFALHYCHILVCFTLLWHSRLLYVTVTFSFALHYCRILVCFTLLSHSRLLYINVTFSFALHYCHILGCFTLLSQQVFSVESNDVILTRKRCRLLTKGHNSWWKNPHLSMNSVSYNTKTH